MTDQIVLYNPSGDLVVDSDIDITGLSISGSAGSANQFLGKDGSNVLGFFGLPATTFPMVIYQPVSGQNINLLAANILTYQAPVYNNLVSEITFSASSIFTFNTSGTYIIMLISNCVASPSDVRIDMTLGVPVISSSRIGTTEFSNVMISTQVITAPISLGLSSNRIGVNTSAKTLTANSSALIIFKLA
jgi:hypothetical protein